MCPTHYRPRELDSFLTDALLRTTRPGEAKLEERNHWTVVSNFICYRCQFTYSRTIIATFANQGCQGMTPPALTASPNCVSNNVGGPRCIHRHRVKAHVLRMIRPLDRRL